LITIPNEKLLSVLGKNSSLLDAFGAANDVLLGAVQGIADLIIRPGMINVDFADVRTVMSEMGQAMMGTGSASGENRAREAAEKAIGSPLLEDVDLQGARGILVNVTAGVDLSLGEFSEVGQVVEEFASDNATVVVGTVIDPSIEDELKVTVVATGLGVKEAPQQEVPKKVVDNTVAEQKVAAVGGAGVATVAQPRQSAVDPADLDVPSYIRKEQAAQQQAAPRAESAKGKDMDYLDIPAFLRRQAD